METLKKISAGAILLRVLRPAVEQQKKRIAILGSTGSIGTQALEVVRANPERFGVEVLVANSRADELIAQAHEFNPNAVVIADQCKYGFVKEALKDSDIKVYAGERSVEQIVEMESIDIVLAGIVGFAGLASTLNAIRHGKQVALANKETLVVAGELVTREARAAGVNLYPVDSEHSAIFQCLAGEWDNPIEKIYLTASGGPFRGKSKEFLRSVTKEMALRHPNWSMGAKITVDSATLMNKGLEVIEARWLFELPAEKIDVIVHPQSIIHSIVQFEDGSMKAQMGVPDMKLPIQYALAYPSRIKNSFPRFDFGGFSNLTFEKPDHEAFPCLNLAYDALRKGGNSPCILNAANEVAVSAFLADRISFTQINEVIGQTIRKVTHIASADYAQYIESDREARAVADSIVNSK